jgi:hypothetical protein
MPIDQPHRLHAPKQCILWEQPELLCEPLNDLFEDVESLFVEDDISRTVLRCKECTQQYVYEYYRNSMHHKVYRTFIPVRTAEEIDLFKTVMTYENFISPRASNGITSGRNELRSGWEKRGFSPRYEMTRAST